MYDPIPEIVHGRTNPHIDPSLSIWGWEIPVYLFLGGVVAGIMVLSALLELQRKSRPSSRAAQWMPFIGVGLLSLGMLALFLDLKHKAHAFRFYLAFEPTSPMSWGSWILLGVYPVLLLLGLGALDTRDRAALARLLRPAAGLLQRAYAIADAHRRGIVLASLGLGVGLGVYTGVLLGTMAARPQWNTGVLGPLFLTSGISTGAASMMLCRLDQTEQHYMVRWDTAAIVVELFLLAVMLLGFVSGGTASKAAADNLLGGPFTPWFWSLVITGGLLVPLAMNILEVRGRTPFTPVSPALVLMGGLALRAVLVAAGQATSFGALG